MDSAGYSAAIGRKCVDVQIKLATQASQALKRDVYVFDVDHHFRDAIVSIVDNIRVLVSSDNRYAVLSTSAQDVIPNTVAGSLIYEQIANRTLHKDDIGVYITV